MRHHTWYTFLIVMLTVLVVLGIGHGSMVGLYTLVTGLDWQVGKQLIGALFAIVPLHLLLGMIVIARYWYGLPISFSWKKFIVGFILVVAFFAKGFWGHVLVHRLYEKLAIIIISNMGTSTAWHIVILALGQALLIWALYVMLLFGGYSLLMSMFYALPSPSVIRGYASFVRMNIVSLIIWSFVFGALHLASSLLSVAVRLQSLVHDLRQLILGQQGISNTGLDLYLAEMTVKVVLVAGMLWIVVSWFARVERYPKTIE